MAKKKFDLMGTIWMAFLTAIVFSVFGFIQGALLSLVISLSVGFANVLQALFGAIWFTVGMMIREGKEDMVESLLALSYVSVVLVILARLPFELPFMGMVIEWSLEGLILTLGTLWLSQAVVKMLKKRVF